MPAPHAASCFAKEAVRQGRPEPPPLPFRSHPSPRLRQIKGGGLQSHQASSVQEFLMGGEGRPLRCKKNLWTAAALDRVLPCVRPLLRRLTGRGPVWEFVDQVHITEARSKRSPFAWFS